MLYYSGNDGGSAGTDVITLRFRLTTTLPNGLLLWYQSSDDYDYDIKSFVSIVLVNGKVI